MRVRPLRIVAAVLALAVAAIHIYWGFPRLVLQLQVMMVPDPRPTVFVATGIAIVLGIARVLDGSNPKPIYLLGIGLMLAYLLGYVAWHTVLGHGGFWPWGPEHHAHGGPALAVVAEHLRADFLALVSKVLELALLVVLAVLYRFE
ncbi:hypothetical protein ACNS7O_12905 [Haloferacaceae archaeon DSL9]